MRGDLGAGSMETSPSTIPLAGPARLGRFLSYLWVFPLSLRTAHLRCRKVPPFRTNWHTARRRSFARNFSTQRPSRAPSDTSTSVGPCAHKREASTKAQEIAFFFGIALVRREMSCCNSSLCEKQFFRLWKIVFRNAAGTRAPCWDEIKFRQAKIRLLKMCFLALPLWNRGQKLQIPFVCLRKTNGQMNLFCHKKNNFSGSQKKMFFWRFSVLTDPWWNEIELCEKTIFWKPKKMFF